MSETLNKLGPIPSDLHALINDYVVLPVTIGASGASVFALRSADKPTFYLKIVTKDSEVTFQPEVERLGWLKGRLPVPEIVFYRQDATGEYLLITEIAGKMACDPIFEGETISVVKALAAGLKMLHTFEIKDCPFDMCLETQIKASWQRTVAGLVDETDFDSERLGRTAAEVFEELIKMRPASEDLVFTHGDYNLPNVILDPSTFEFSGFIDLGRCGVADRYQDLALAVRSLIRNWGREFIPALFEEYGIKEHEVDWGKIEFYKLLDEFF